MAGSRAVSAAILDFPFEIDFLWLLDDFDFLLELLEADFEPESWAHLIVGTPNAITHADNIARDIRLIMPLVTRSIAACTNHSPQTSLALYPQYYHKRASA